jgi:predicted Zn-dependent protease
MSEQSFGQFLLAQKGASGALGELALAASKDPKFPKQGKPEDVAKLLHAQQAPAEFHEAMVEAVADWQALI